MNTPTTLGEYIAAGYRPMVLPGLGVGGSVLMTKGSQPGTSVTVRDTGELQYLYEHFQIESGRKKFNAQTQQASTTTDTTVNSEGQSQG
jgi:hypothetical protein